MKLISRLEKSKSFWFLIIISVVFFLFRLPSLVEPNWYGDEGIYQIIGMYIHNGGMLYSDIWDNKPPLLYLVYAFFNGDQFGVRVASLLTGLVSCWLFFYLSRKLFEKIKVSIIATSIFAILFSIPLIEGNIANAENFMLLPIIAAAILIFDNSTRHKPSTINYRLISAGILLGVAFLFKIVAVFDLAAFLVFLVIIYLPKRLFLSEAKKMLNQKPWLSSLLHDSFFIILGFLTPIIITILYFFFNHALTDFIRATFFGNIGYVGYANQFIIPQGFLILKLLILVVFVLFAASRREKISKAAIFVLIWIAFALFNALFSQRPYTHYVLTILPSFCLLIGLILNENKMVTKKFFILTLISVLVVLSMTFKLYNFKKTIFYYQNALFFITGKKDVNSYQAFFDKKTPRDYQLASFIKMHTDRNDRVFIWGDSAQIYALSKTFPINKYTVAYHIKQDKEGIKKTQDSIDKIKPKYIIILYETTIFPFKISSYVNRYSMDKAIIYERAF